MTARPLAGRSRHGELLGRTLGLSDAQLRATLDRADTLLAEAIETLCN